MFGPRPKPGVLRRSDIAETAQMLCLDVDEGAPRALVLTGDGVMAAWIAQELRASEIELAVVGSVDAAIAGLIGIPPPHPQLLIVDLDPLDAAATFQLHALRALGWFGAIVAIGSVSPDLRVSLAIHRVLARPLEDGSLDHAVASLGLCSPTRPVTILPGPDDR